MSQIEPRHITDAVSADHYEMIANQRIEEVQDPDEAERLLAEVIVAEEVVRFAEWAKGREKRWRGIKLKAERKYGQLLGPAREGGQKGNQNASKRNDVRASHVVSGLFDGQARRQARKVAAVPQEEFDEYVETAENPSRAGLLNDMRERVKEALLAEESPTGRGIARALGLNDDRQIRKLWDSLYAAGEVPVPRPQKEAPHETKPSTPVRPKRAKNWNGKSNATRQRELRSAKKTGTYGDLINIQVRLNQLSLVLEDIRVWEYSAEDLHLEAIAGIYDDLISLGEWYDRTLSAIQGWLGETATREKIAKLRDTTGRTPEEAATAQKLADRLERKLSSRLS